MWKSTPSPSPQGGSSSSNDSNKSEKQEIRAYAPEHKKSSIDERDGAQGSRDQTQGQVEYFHQISRDIMPRSGGSHEVPALTRRTKEENKAGKDHQAHASDSRPLPGNAPSGIENSRPLLNSSPSSQDGYQSQFPKPAYSATEKFPDFSPLDFAFSVSNHSNDPRSRANTTRSLYSHNPKSRSATDAELAVEMMSDEAIAKTRTELLTAPPPPASIQEVRDHRSALKDTRRRLISEIIRPRTISRAQAILKKERSDFKTEEEHIEARNTALDVLERVGALEIADAERREEVKKGEGGEKA